MSLAKANRIIIGFFVVFGLFAICAQIGKDDDRFDSVDAKQACEAVIESRLNYPATSEFNYNNFPNKGGSGNWLWRASVTASNAFGVPSKIEFLCEVDPTTGDATVVME